MLHLDDEEAVAREFGVSTAQVRRDHLISHLLAALSNHLQDKILFIGGTALSRSHIPHGRLSEDLDLIAIGSRKPIAHAIQDALISATRREFPGLTWLVPLDQVTGAEPAILRTTDGLTVRVQLLREVGYPRWPATMTPLVQRYRDAPPASLMVPTMAAFAASKTDTWHQRAAARDLYDLWLLSRQEAFTQEAAQLFKQHGSTGKLPTANLFRHAPDETAWVSALGGQTTLTITAAEAAVAVIDAWSKVTSDDQDHRADM